MDTEVFASKLWDTAGVITGFAILQSLAYIYALTRREFSVDTNSKRFKLFMTFVGGFFTVCYLFSVWWCSIKAIQLSDKVIQSDMSAFLYDRMFAIILFAEFAWISTTLTDKFKERLFR